MDKKIICVDRNDIKDVHNIYPGMGIKGTDILIKDEMGNTLFKGHNKVIMPGSAFTAAKHFGISPAVSLPSYNSALGLDNTVSSTPANTELCCLFAVGTDGSGAEPSQILDVDYTKWCDPSKLVPFRYVPVSGDLSGAERTKYFGRKLINNQYAAYYFKAFESTPAMYMRYTDGTSVDSSLYSNLVFNEAETLVEVNLKITKEDCREFFEITSDISNARVNSLMLLTGWYTTVGGYKYYQNVQPLTKLNISTKDLSDVTLGLDIIYDIYY